MDARKNMCMRRLRMNVIAFAIVLCLSHLGLFGQSEWKLQSIERMLENSRSDLLIRHKFVYGYQLSVAVVFGHGNNSQFRFCLSGGVAKAVDINRPLQEMNLGYTTPPLLPSYQTEIIAYRGGIGSSLRLKERGRILFEMRNNFNLTLGASATANKEFIFYNPGRPIPKLEANSQAALFDPYDWSFTFGTTFFTGLNHKRNQQVGCATIGIYAFQASYSNDGPPFHLFEFSSGDAFDRWWTGGGHVGVYLPRDHTLITEIVLRYDKFTGWQPNAYEMASQLKLDYVPYIDKREAFQNQGGYNLTVGFMNNLMIGANCFETGRVDFQNFIHSTLGMPFHQTQLRSRQSLTYGYRFFNTYGI